MLKKSHSGFDFIQVVIYWGNLVASTVYHKICSFKTVFGKYTEHWNTLVYEYFKVGNYLFSYNKHDNQA